MSEQFYPYTMFHPLFGVTEVGRDWTPALKSARIVERLRAGEYLFCERSGRMYSAQWLDDNKDNLFPQAI